MKNCMIFLLCVAMLGCSAAGDMVKKTAEFGESMKAKQDKSEFERNEKISKGLRELVLLSSDKAANSMTVHVSSGAPIPLPEDVAPYETLIAVKGFDTKKMARLKMEMANAVKQSIGDLNMVIKAQASNVMFSQPIEIASGKNSTSAASSYFFKVKRADIMKEFSPIISKSLDAGEFNSLAAEFKAVYERVPIENRPALNLRNHVMDVAVLTFASEMSSREAEIRRNPYATNNAQIVYALTLDGEPLVSFDYK